MRGIKEVAHLAGRAGRVKGSFANERSQHLIVTMQINLLNLLADFARSEFHSHAKHATDQARPKSIYNSIYKSIQTNIQTIPEPFADPEANLRPWPRRTPRPASSQAT